jgi:ribosomal protein S18 acetylase RimI-like enzyme
MLPNYFHTTLRQAIENDLAMTTDDCLGVSVWSPKHRKKKMDVSTQPEIDKSSPLTLAMLQLENNRPQEVHLHLRILATDPMARRQGIGRLLATTPPPSLQDQTLPIYLEATTPDSLAFYKKIGFSIISDIEIPEGPQLWGMQWNS